jgi:hypothetical protein
MALNPLHQGPSVAEVRFRHDRNAQPMRMVAAFVDVPQDPDEPILFVATGYTDPWDSHPADHELQPVEVHQEGDRLRVVTKNHEVTLTPWEPREDPEMDENVQRFERWLADKGRTYRAERKRVMRQCGRG